MSESEEEKLRRRRLLRELDIWADRVERELLEDRLSPSERLNALWMARFGPGAQSLKAMHDHLMDVEAPKLFPATERGRWMRTRTATIEDSERAAMGEAFTNVVVAQGALGQEEPVESALKLWVERARDEVELYAERVRTGEAEPELLTVAQRRLAELQEISDQALGDWGLPGSPIEPAGTGLVKAGQLEIDMASGQTRLGGREAKLSPAERKILATLALNPGRTVTMPALQRGAGIGLPAAAGGRGSLAVHVNNIKERLGDREVVSAVVGVGFQLGPAVLEPSVAEAEERKVRRLDRVGRPEISPEGGREREPGPGPDRERDE